MKYLKKFNESTGYQPDFYRGVGFDEAIKACKAGHLIYYSKDPMSRDWEVIEYSMGDRASDASDEDIEKFVDSTVPWEDNGKGVNLTTDLENAKGYSTIVLGIEVNGDTAEFSHVHVFARCPEECIVKNVYYKGSEMTTEEFLEIGTRILARLNEELSNPIINDCEDILLELKDKNFDIRFQEFGSKPSVRGFYIDIRPPRDSSRIGLRYNSQTRTGHSEYLFTWEDVSEYVERIIEYCKTN